MTKRLTTHIFLMSTTNLYMHVGIIKKDIVANIRATSLAEGMLTTLHLARNQLLCQGSHPAWP